MQRSIFFLVVILCVLVIPVGATGKLQSDVKARDVFSAMVHQHEWLLEVATSQVLIDDITHENLRLLTFGHSDEDKHVFSLVVTDSEGDFQILDISDSIDQSYSFFDIETGWLENDPIFLVTGLYFTWHKDPTLYIIDDSGVLFSACGSDIMYKDSRVVAFPFSGVWDTRGSLPFIMDDEIDSNYGNFAAAYQIAPHVREAYSLDAVSRIFVLEERTPVTQYAVLGDFLEAIRLGQYDAALQHLSDNWSISGDKALEALMNDMFPDLVSFGAERFISATDYSIRFRTTSGVVYDAIFNKPDSECYVPWRARREEQIPNFWCEPPRIVWFNAIQQ